MLRNFSNEAYGESARLNFLMVKALASFHAVPFGLRADEMVRPEAVPNGKACGCICPECRGPLLAKNAGLKYKPHFAHMAGMGSDLCRETAIHLMAKQVLMGASQLMLPKWEKQHTERDISGQPHHCVEARNAKAWTYAHAQEEVWQDGIRPDVLLSDMSAVASLPLLVEIKVSHAVDQFKAQLVQKRGWAMMEIDVSKALDGLIEDVSFEDFVLNSAPREWIHAPKAEQRFAEKRKALCEMVAALNGELRRKGVEKVDEFGHTKSDRVRQRRIDILRSERREPFLADIQALEIKTHPDALHRLEEERHKIDADAIRTLLMRHGGRLPAFAKSAHKDAWVVKASTTLWQLAAAEHFVYEAAEGSLVRDGVVSRWVADRFGMDEQAERLIAAQRKDRDRRKRRGDTGLDLQRHAWFFDDWENRLVPSLFHAVDALMERLVSAGLLLKRERWVYAVDGPVGRESRRVANEQRAALAEEARRREAQAEEERKRLASIQWKASLEKRQRRIECIAQAYEQLAEHEQECLDCQHCRWPRAVGESQCASCGSANGELIRLDEQRLREMPHRLRSDPRVMGGIRYPFE